MNQQLTLAVSNAQRAADILRHFAIDPPAELDEALAVHDAVTIPTAPRSIDTVLADVTRAETIEAVRRWLDDKRAHEARERNAAEILTASARRVARAHITTADQALESARPAFSDWADKFSTAFASLPAGWRDANAVIEHGGTVADAYLAARTAVAELDMLRELRRVTPGTHIDGQIATGLEFTTAPNTLVAEDIAKARPTSPLGRWAEWLEVDPTVTLTWRTTAEHRDAINACPVWKMTAHKTTTGGFTGITQRPTPVDAPTPPITRAPNWDQLAKTNT